MAPPRPRKTPARRSRSAKPDLFPSLGDIAERWIEQRLIHGEGDFFGRPFRLTPDQRLFLWRWYEYEPGTLTSDGEAWVAAVRAGEIPARHLIPEPPEWRYREAFICCPKGEGKSEYCAAMGVLEFAGPPVIAPRSPNVPIAAASFDQANELFGAAQTMCGGAKGAEVESSPLRGLFTVFDTEILFADGRPGRLFRVAAQAGTKDGGKPTCFLADEIHEWKGPKARLHTVIANSIMKRRKGRILNMSTVGAGTFSSPPKDSDPLWWKSYVQALEAIRYPSRHPRLLAMVRQAPEGLDPSKRADVEKGIRAASSAADVFWDVADRVDRFFDPKVPKHECIRYFWNRPTDADEESWLEEHPGAWVAGAKPKIKIKPGTPVGVAVDMALRHDSVAVSWGYVRPDGRAVVRCRFFTARGGKIDHLEVWRFITEELATANLIEWVVYDPRFFELPAVMAEEQGFNMIELPQSPERMAPACGHALDEIVNGRVLHDGDPALASHINHAARREGERGFTLSKTKSKGHIDGAVSLVMLLWTLAAPPPADVEDAPLVMMIGAAP